LLLLNNNAFCLDTHTIRKEEVRVEWDANTEPDLAGYELIVEGKDVVFTSEVIQTTNTSIVVPRPRSGHFKIKVRAYDTDGNRSEWTISDVSGIPEPWEVYWKPNIPFHIFVIEDF